MSATAADLIGSARRVRVWDVPTRLAHWSLAGLFAFSWWSANNHHMDYHRYSGYTLLGVLVFRVYWGLVGSHTARFARFVKGPRAIWGYLRAGLRHPVPGHNPLGALSVLALLGVLLSQVVLGLFSVDVDGLESGPLSTFVSFDVGRACAHAHHVVFDVLAALIALHLTAILFYWIIKRDNLVRPMLTGWKSWNERPASHGTIAPWWLAALGVALSVVVVSSIVR
jgi:cytochrome b